MAVLQVTATDIARIKTVLSALKRGKWTELEGEEILAFAQAFGWTAQLASRLEASLKDETEEPASC